jgi:hypothetical protein
LVSEDNQDAALSLNTNWETSRFKCHPYGKGNDITSLLDLSGIGFDLSIFGELFALRKCAQERKIRKDVFEGKGSLSTL